MMTLEKQVAERGRLILGLDPNPKLMPKKVSILEFSDNVIKACAPHIMGIKIQMAYFEAFDVEGIFAIREIISKAKKAKLWIMIDGKRGDIGSTADSYANKYYFKKSPLSVNAVTINPLMGSDTVFPFINKAEVCNKHVFSLLYTSNPSGDEILGLPEVQEKLIAMHQEHGDVLGAVVGATRPEKIAELREKLPNTWFLCPGVGAQGGDADAALAGAKHHKVIFPVSRGILYASTGDNYAEAAARKAQELYTIVNAPRP